MKTATFVKSVDFKVGARQAVYRMDPPLPQYETVWPSDSRREPEKKLVAEHKFVVVSALSYAFDTGRPETYIFPSDENGEISCWSELDGSYRGGIDHWKAFENIGYTLVIP